MAKKILMICGVSVETTETMVPFRRSGRRPYGCRRVPGKKAGDTIATAIPTSRVTRPTPKRGHSFALNTTFAEIRAEDYDALVIWRARPGVPAHEPGK